MRDDDDGRGVGLSTTDKFSLDLRTRIQQKIYILTQSIMQYTILVRRSSCFFIAIQLESLLCEIWDKILPVHPNVCIVYEMKR